MRVAIVGGGISGLATAFYLNREQPDWEILLLEAGPRLGGTMGTENVGGFLFEIGSNGFLSNKPDTLTLVEDAGAGHLMIRSNDLARVRYIYHQGLHRLPESPPAFVRTRLLSLGGKLRTLGEVLVAPRTEDGDETLQSFGYRRVGKEFTDVFLNAMVAGIYGSTPEDISVNAAFPAVVKLERDYGGLFKGMIKKRKKEAGPGGVLMGFERGVRTLVELLGPRLGAGVRTGTPVQGLCRGGDAYTLHLPEGATETVDKLVLCTPAFTASDLLQDVDHHIAMQLDAVEYSPISVVGLGYHQLDHPLDGFGLLTTAAARQQVLGVLWDSSVFPDRAPSGAKSMRAMIGGQRSPDLALQDDDQLVETALRGVRETMGVDTPPDVTFVKRWERGIPNYKVGHLANVDGIFEKLRRHPGLYLNSNAYYGVSLNDCVRNSREAAARIAAPS